MATFAYRLEPVRRVKKQLENLAKDALGREMAELARRKQALARDVREAEEAMAAFRRDAGGTFTVAGIRGRNDHIMLSRKRVERSEASAQEAEASADEARAALVRAAQEREMFDKLRGKALDAYMAEERKKEQRVADETVSYKLGVALAGGGENV